jgi:tetratricopeptide (TPR) repeat protein
MKNHDMSYKIDTETLRAYPNNKDEMLLGISLLEEELKNISSEEELAKKLSMLSYYQKLVENYSSSELNQLKAISLFESLNDSKGLFVAKLRVAQLKQFKKEYIESTKLFDELEVELEDNTFLEPYRDFLYQHVAKNEFEKKNYNIALEYFYKALEIRIKKNDKELIDSTQLGIRESLRLSEK